MKKNIKYLAVIIVTAFLMFNINNKNKETDENRGIFFSYSEFFKYFHKKSSNEIRKEIENIIKNVKDNYLNNVYVQVRPFSDSIYNSDIFPFSHIISGTQGEKIDLDVLEYFINIAHKENIKIHAWINPYRISNDTDTSFISKDNPAYKWLNTNNVKVIENKGIYYNPASEEVRNLIVDGVIEIIKNYDIDGILFDDYFYPDDSIDLEDYKNFQSTISIKDFRLSQVNKLISSVYKAIKNINKNVLFGISPDGNIENNYDTHYADVKKWLSEDGYIDYIMPQLYYGFLNENKPFIKTINEWNNLIKNDVKMIPALALYKSGSVDKYAGNGSNEWVENSNIIKNEIQVSRKISNYIGFSLYRYYYLVEPDKNTNLVNEILNYRSLFEN